LENLKKNSFDLCWFEFQENMGCVKHASSLIKFSSFLSWNSGEG